METAGAKDMPEDAERRGLGTPATRAAVIEKLVATGFAERRKAKKSVRLVPTEAGVSLITVLPEQLQSPLLTAEWEHRLKEIECGELGADEFLAGICDMVAALVRDAAPVDGAEVLFPSGRPVVGKCPRCGAEVTESKNGYFCERRSLSPSRQAKPKSRVSEKSRWIEASVWQQKADPLSRLAFFRQA